MKNRSILIVEDSEVGQYIAKYVIKKYDPGLDILQAYDGQEALELLSEIPKQPIIILLDINMPRMNGHEFLQQYETSELNKTNVIMLTSSCLDKDKDRCLWHKCVKKYLTKPLATSDLETILTIPI
ncbi:MAG: response regulator [Aliiglaciecola sp.]|uniref:response regulator n=1 Tax=Aliiglaciecola sp. TaxID=1872441 RepID=UPI003297185A